MSPSALRRAGAALARRGKGRTTMVAGVPGDVAAFAEGALLASYEFKIGEPAKKRPLASLVVMTEAGPEACAAPLARARVVAGATVFARDLANATSQDKCPEWLAEQARKLAADSGLTIRVRDEAELAAGGFGGLIAVGSGSPRPPRLIELTYDPGHASMRRAGGAPVELRAGGAPAKRRAGGAPVKHCVLVGKGITFDTGGISLKPTDNMKTMKTDMSGGAVVMAVLGALGALDADVKVTGLIPAAENAFSGSAMRPSDVITHFGGKTSEVLNTDAEGRLVLADALAYAAAELAPDLIVDIATLTGAAKVALGLKHGALFATDDALASELTEAGTASGEALWRLPLTEDYRVAIESDVADLANIERRGFGGGAIMAALFLREFTGGIPWAHLDVAGPGRAMSDEGELSKGATGFGTRLLLNWLTA
jgi:leucyl aminopeptidase